jgi:hypothetical protein
MAVQCAVGSFTVTTADTGNRAITGVGFLPQIYFLFGSQSTSTGSGLYTSDGVTDGTRSYCQSAGATDNLTATTNSRRYTNTDRVLNLIAGDGTIHGAFAHLSFDADGFTLDHLTTPAITFTVSYVALAGLSDVYVDAYEFTAGTGNFSRTAAGFQADAIIWMGAGNATLGTAANTALRTLGWSLSNGTQFAAGLRHQSAVTSDYTSSSAATDRVLYAVTAAGASSLCDLAMVSHDATGFTANRVLNMSGGETCAVHLKGGVWTAGTTTAQAATGNFDVTTTGCNPAGVLLMASNITTASRTTPFEGGNVCLGATDGTAQWATEVHSYNAEPISGSSATEEFTTVSATRMWRHSSRTSANTLTLDGDIALSSLGTEKFTLNQTDADPTAVLIGYLAVGDAPAGGGGGSNTNALMQLGAGT